MKILLAAVGLFLFGALPSFAEVLEKTADVNGVAVHYKVVLPRDYDSNRTYPGVLAFGGGGQTMDVVESMIANQFQQEAEKRGYIVISPAAPNGELFVFVDGEIVIPGLVAKVLADYKIQDNKFHIAGRSNGGISAFHLAALYPQYFVSITAFPGFLTELTPSRLKGISTMCIYMHVGELDADWRGQMTDQSEFFRDRGMRVQFTVEEGQAHSIDSLGGPGSARLFEHFDEARRGCGK
jgi:poly(3-hydroxybutyrate) depolymerase